MIVAAPPACKAQALGGAPEPTSGERHGHNTLQLSANRRVTVA